MESPEKAETPKGTPGSICWKIVAAVVLVPVLAVVGPRIWWYGASTADYAAKTATFSGNSDRLQQTAIVPTLDSPCPTGRNVIWCSSFQLAWNEVRDKAIGAPIEIPDAAQITARLNAGRQSMSDLDAKSVYATGGWVEKGIREKIKKDMAAKFPSHGPLDFSAYTSGILAYSYLTARVPFKYPFRQVGKGISFTDSQSVQTRVAGFGLWTAFLDRYKGIRDQVEVLHTRWGSDSGDDSREITECALDLCRHSEPYQVVVAKIEWQGSLGETLQYVRTQIAESRKQPGYEIDKRFGGNDELRLPEMFWRIDHQFKELIDKTVANSNPAMPIVGAFQTIEFRLDRSGVMLESDSNLAVASTPRYFEFNRPFLVYMQKRGAEHPFFVMWVDNAELLVRK
jgi:hypothetical protein